MTAPDGDEPPTTGEAVKVDREVRPVEPLEAGVVAGDVAPQGDGAHGRLERGSRGVSPAGRSGPSPSVRRHGVYQPSMLARRGS